MYCALAICVNESNRCWPSFATIANLVNTSRKTAIRSINVLRQKGLIHVTERTDKGSRRRPNVYELLEIPCAQDAAAYGDKIDPGDRMDRSMGTKTTRAWCQKRPSNKDYRNKGKKNKDGKDPPQKDSSSEKSKMEKDIREHLLEGTPFGRMRFNDVVGEISDRDARIRTLVKWRLARDKQEAAAIIAAYDPIGSGS